MLRKAMSNCELQGLMRSS